MPLAGLAHASFDAGPGFEASTGLFGRVAGSTVGLAAHLLKTPGFSMALPGTPKSRHRNPPQLRRNNSGSLAIFAAIHRASSRVSKGSQRRPSFFNIRYSAARPMIAPFFFESETAGVMFV